MSGEQLIRIWERNNRKKEGVLMIAFIIFFPPFLLLFNLSHAENEEAGQGIHHVFCTGLAWVCAVDFYFFWTGRSAPISGLPGSLTR